MASPCQSLFSIAVQSRAINHEEQFRTAFTNIPPDSHTLVFYGVISLVIVTGGMNVICSFMSSVKHSPLTTTVAGNTKDLVQTLVGGYFFKDYKFDPMNGVGILLSFIGCAGYVRAKTMA